MDNEITHFDDMLKSHTRASWASGFFAGATGALLLTLVFLFTALEVFH